MKISVEKLLEGVKLIGAIDVDYCVNKDENKKRTIEEIEERWKDKVENKSKCGNRGADVCHSGTGITYKLRQI